MTRFLTKTIIVFASVLFAWGVASGDTLADSCKEEISAMHYDGPLDPFARPPYRSEKQVFDADGNMLWVFDDIVETPLKTVSGVRGSGSFALVVDRSVWTGPSLEGPWSSAPSNFPKDREAALKRTRDLRVEGITMAKCAGEVTLDGKTVRQYIFQTKPAPDEKQGGMWFAERSTVFVDPQKEEVVRWEMTDFQSSFMPDVNKEMHVFTFSYDPDLTVDIPQ